MVNYNANANFTYAGQALVGTGAYAAGTNVVASRYATTGADNIINCTGNTSAVAATFVNTFSLDGNGNCNARSSSTAVSRPGIRADYGIH